MAGPVKDRLSVGGSKATATLTSDSFAGEGFAKAIERFILGDAI